MPAEGGIALSALAQHLAIALTPAGQARVAADTVLNTPRLAAALEQLSPAARRALLKGVEQLATAGELLPDADAS